MIAVPLLVWGSENFAIGYGSVRWRELSLVSSADRMQGRFPTAEAFAWSQVAAVDGGGS